MTKKKRITISLSDGEMFILDRLSEMLEYKTYSKTVSTCIVFGSMCILNLMVTSDKEKEILEDGNKKRE